MTPPVSIAESEGTRVIAFGIPSEEVTSSLRKQEDKLEYTGFGVPKSKFVWKPTFEEGTGSQSERQEELVKKSELPPRMESFAQAIEESFVATHREELYGYVKKIVEDKAYIVFETPGEPLERVVKLSRLTPINADRQGALIRLVVVVKGASMNLKFENLEEKAIATWRDKIKDEDLEKYDLLKKSALPQKPSKLK